MLLLCSTYYENENAVNETLQRLQTDYIDLLFIDQPSGNFVANRNSNNEHS